MRDKAYIVGAIDIYEIKAAAFRRCTGMMAPGKDQAAGASGPEHETRVEVWNLWTKVYGEVIHAVISSTIETLPPLA